ncbi:hypothetical protein MD484_g6811, partial [Candolleomyces efflorescens]
MVANVIAFEHPSLKIYQSLPVSRPDLDELLAVVFTGVSPPTVDDLKRTPVLVRRNKVRDALEWLKLNHVNYSDLNIDYKTLDTYPMEGVPVEVMHQEQHDDRNVPATAQSKFDDETEIGTESGPCPFTVHGLTGDRYEKMTTQQRKAAALRHLKNSGDFLAIGHDPNPQSMYENPSLYPSMFPWLFPYGHGSIGQKCHMGLISRETHIKWCLMYHDKRFQEDAGFVIVMFNHQLIRQGTSGSFMLVKRNNFDNVADKIRNISQSVLSSISQKLKDNPRYRPETPEEKLCFSLLDQIEYVGGQVDGSLAKKKYQRNELWSLVSFSNAPQWFLTLSPADNKHPLCIYMASHDIEFKPEIKGYAERQHLVTRNPVACARFFDHVVKLFIKHICGWSDEDQTRGLFGKPSGYYGTVEQQGRMTLHLHFLLWIEGAPSPQEIRDRLMKEDNEFQTALIEYLESCRVGELLTGTRDEVAARMPKAKEASQDRGIHTILVESDVVNNGQNVPVDYVDPTLTMPHPPPSGFCRDIPGCKCSNCEDLEKWWVDFQMTVDDIVYCSNTHKCFGRRDNTNDNRTPDASTNHNGISTVPKLHATGKGCVNKDGICTARFPRDVYPETVVDHTTGRIDLKKKDEWMNDVTPVIAGLFRCNTDSTCLLSGTAVKAILGYVTDYITKGWLKTHQVFSTMYDAFSRKKDPATDENQKAAKMEIGAPMAALYLLDNPDCYCSHKFKTFYWKNYVSFVQGEWDGMLASQDPQQLTNLSLEQEVADSQDVGIDRSHVINQVVQDLVDGDIDDTVQVKRSNNSYVGKSTTDDYRWRPAQHERVCLYEWIQCNVRLNDDSSRSPGRHLAFFNYQPEHPLHQSHSVACDLDRRAYVVPNFIGPPLPRYDVGDEEFYYCTMLTFFCPWRTGLDLKAASETWKDAFNKFNFTDRQKSLMSNFRVRYECYDARDDFGAQFRSMASGPSECDDEEEMDTGLDGDGNIPESEMLDDDSPGINARQGPITQGIQIVNNETTAALVSAGWNSRQNSTQVKSFNLPKVCVDRNFNSTAWKSIIRFEKRRLFQQKFNGHSLDFNTTTGSGIVRNDAYVIPGSYLTNDYIPPVPEWGNIIEEIAHKYELNMDQRRAFNIVANHATCVAPEQLLMYLGGMGGTGKSRALQGHLLL